MCEEGADAWMQTFPTDPWESTQQGQELVTTILHRKLKEHTLHTHILQEFFAPSLPLKTG